jgi:hypothetical membrane protein
MTSEGKGKTGTSFARCGAIVGLATPILFILLVVVMGFLHPGYSHLTNFISDLGALDAPLPYVQRLNFFQLGIGIAILAVELYKGTERASRVALAFQLAIGFGIFLSGIFPGHSDDPESRATLLHNLAGGPAFLLIMMVPLVAGWRFRQRKQWKDLAGYSMAMTPVLVAMFVLMGRADGMPGGFPGLFQRLFIGIWLFWMILVSCRLLRLEGSSHGVSGVTV